MNSTALSNYECIGYDTRRHVKPVLPYSGMNIRWNLGEQFVADYIFV